MVADPVATPVICPLALIIEATPELLEDQVPLLPLLANVTLAPTHPVCVPLNVPAEEAAVTVTVRFADAPLHPAAAGMV